VTEDGATVEDCGSKNGTFLGGDRVGEPVLLRDGDRVLLGSALLVFRSFPRDRSSTATDAGARPTAPLPQASPEPPAPRSHV
jgi:pSer/pThr/pTyr-binding forkhead associated (FHA) protein